MREGAGVPHRHEMDLKDCYADMNAMLPCHVIAGPLGAGKTTAILHYLKTRRPEEKVAVIVNDFGRAGLDAEIIGSHAERISGNLEVRNVPGGCLCCSSQEEIGDALRIVLKGEGVSRVIIEPSGLAILRDFIPYLRGLCEEFPLELRPVIVLINPRRVTEAHYRELPFFTSLIDHADILVGNRMDQCGRREREAFLSWSRSLRSSKRMVVETSFGRLPDSIFALPGGELSGGESRDSPEGSSGDPHRHGEYAGGMFDPEVAEVSAERFRRQLQVWVAEGLCGGKILRFKGILPTGSGWKLFEIAEDSVFIRPMSRPCVASIDWIAEREVGVEVVQEALRRAADGRADYDSRGCNGMQSMK